MDQKIHELINGTFTIQDYVYDTNLQTIFNYMKNKYKSQYDKYTYANNLLVKKIPTIIPKYTDKFVPCILNNQIQYKQLPYEFFMYLTICKIYPDITIKIFDPLTIKNICKNLSNIYTSSTAGIIPLFYTEYQSLDITKNSYTVCYYICHNEPTDKNLFYCKTYDVFNNLEQDILNFNKQINGDIKKNKTEIKYISNLIDQKKEFIDCIDILFQNHGSPF